MGVRRDGRPRHRSDSSWHLLHTASAARRGKLGEGQLAAEERGLDRRGPGDDGAAGLHVRPDRRQRRGLDRAVDLHADRDRAAARGHLRGVAVVPGEAHDPRPAHEGLDVREPPLQRRPGHHGPLLRLLQRLPGPRHLLLAGLPGAERAADDAALHPDGRDGVHCRLHYEPPHLAPAHVDAPLVRQLLGISRLHAVRDTDPPRHELLRFRPSRHGAQCHRV